MRIEAAVVGAAGDAFRIEGLETAALRDQEVLVELVACGVCQTDAHVRDQHIPVPLPAVLGHEGAGIVRQVGTKVRHLAPGDPVVMSFRFCGECRSCKHGAFAYCYQLLPLNFGGSRPDGSQTLFRHGEDERRSSVHASFFGQSSFATHAVAHEDSVIRVRRDVPLHYLAPFGCGFQTGYGAVVNSLQVKSGTSIAVIGTGAVGMVAIMAARIAGADTIIGVDVNEERLRLAQSVGATHVVNPDKIDISKAVWEILPDGVDYALEITGRPELTTVSVDILAPLGVAGFVGTAAPGTKAPIDMLRLLLGRTVRGIHQGDSVSQRLIPEMVDHFAAGRLPVDRLIRTYPFGQINEAFADAKSGAVIKPVLTFAQGEGTMSDKVAVPVGSQSAGAVLPRARHWIGGSWEAGGHVSTTTNPATGGVVGEYWDADLNVAQRAVSAASSAFKSTSWKEDRHLRARTLNRMADAFEAAMPKLAKLLTAENGKPFGEALFEVSTMAPKLRYWAGMALVSQGRASEPLPGRFSMVLRQPIGVAGIIVPWNAPAALAVRSLAPALAAGTTAALKLPGKTAQTNACFSEILAELPELPPGVVNTFTESTAVGAKFLVDSPDVPVISFTGSTATGREIAAAGAARLKRLSLELGGKSPMVVFDDANLDVVAAVAVKALTTFSGQFCMTSSRLLVQRNIAARLRDQISSMLAAVCVGAGDDPKSEMGPLIDSASVRRVDEVVQAAIAAGARAIVRGGPSSDPRLSQGAFYHPTFLEVADSALDIVQKETFGPVLTLETFATEEQAVELANATAYGLAASIWTGDNSRAFRVSRGIDAGTIWLNNWALLYDEFEEGGFKQSGLGRLNGTTGMDVFMEHKHIAFDAHLPVRR